MKESWRTRSLKIRVSATKSLDSVFRISTAQPHPFGFPSSVRETSWNFTVFMPWNFFSQTNPSRRTHSFKIYCFENHWFGNKRKSVSTTTCSSPWSLEVMHFHDHLSGYSERLHYWLETNSLFRISVSLWVIAKNRLENRDFIITILLLNTKGFVWIQAKRSSSPKSDTFR